MEVATSIQLTPDQAEARTVVLDRINMGSRFVKLTGHAGAGKTTLVALLAEELQTYGYDVFCCAPTHKAAHVLGQKMPIETQTIHSFLGLQMRRNNRDGGYMLVQKDNVSLPEEGVVVLDESSMIGTQLWRYIDAAPGLQWLFVGDPAQLPPVAEKMSPALRVDGAHLSGIVRQAQGNPILRMAEKVRNGEPYLNEAAYNGDVGVVLTRDSRRLMNSITKGFSEQDASTPPEVRVLTYRNDVVAWYNDAVRQELLGTKKPPRFAAGDWLMMNNTYFEAQETVCKNSEEVQVTDATVSQVVTTGGFWKVHRLTVRREDGDEVEFPVLHKSEEDRYYAILKKLKLECIRKARPWPDYYALVEAFADCSHAYAMTIHKSQGSTFRTVYVDHVDAMTCRGPERQALVYVAITRPSEKLALLI